MPARSVRPHNPRHPVPVVYSDAADNPTGTDWADVYMANDNDYVYVRITLHSNAGLDVSDWQHNYYIDGDNDDATGFHVWGLPSFGSSMLIQSGVGYQQAGGGFNEGTLAGSAVAFAPLFAGPVMDVEFQVDRNVVGVSGAFAGAPLITGDTIQFVAQTDVGTGDAADSAVDGISYTFAPIPEPAAGALAIALLGGACAWRRRT